MHLRLAPAAALALGLLAGPLAARDVAPLPPFRSPPEPPFLLHEFYPGVFAAIDGPGHKAGSNAGFVIGDDGVVVIDAFFTPTVAKALLDEIRRRTDKPIRWLVNTHYHLDHTGGDEVFVKAGAQIVAHRNARAWVRTENGHLLGPGLTPERAAQIAALPLADVTTSTELSLWLGDRRVEVRAFTGHTGGDLAVIVPDAHAVFAGDLFWRRTSPNIIDGNLKRWVADDSELLKLGGAEGVYVPGHGELGLAADLADFRAYLADLRADTAGARARGLAGAALEQAVESQMRPKWGSWDLFAYFLPKEAAFADAELAGTKAVPKPPTD